MAMLKHLEPTGYPMQLAQNAGRRPGQNYTDQMSYGHLRRSDALWSVHWAGSSIGQRTGDQPF